jgi:hypothetical protein
MAFKKDLISLLDESENGKIYGMLNIQYMTSCVQIGFFHLVRASIYYLILICSISLQVICYTSCLCIKPVCLGTNTNITNQIKYSLIPSLMHSKR